MLLLFVHPTHRMRICHQSSRISSDQSKFDIGLLKKVVTVLTTAGCWEVLHRHDANGGHSLRTTQELRQAAKVASDCKHGCSSALQK